MSSERTNNEVYIAATVCVCVCECVCLCVSSKTLQLHRRAAQLGAGTSPVNLNQLAARIPRHPAALNNQTTNTETSTTVPTGTLQSLHKWPWFERQTDYSEMPYSGP